MALLYVAQSAPSIEGCRSTQIRNIEKPMSDLDVNDSRVSQENPVGRNYGGIGRLVYIIIVIGVAFAFSLLLLNAGISDADENGYILLTGLYSIILMFPSYFRLKNIGRDPMECFYCIIPLLNILVNIRCLILPAGYKDIKKLDAAAKIILGFIILVFLWGIIGLVIS